MTTTNISLSRLVPFEEHPYQVRDDEEMQALTDSIKEQGVLSPVIVRPLENGNYEIISGHRRCHAAQKAGLTSVPAVVFSLTHEEAAVALVDSNLHREHLLPSEKAFAYKLKSEAMKHQGKKKESPENLWDASLIDPSMGQNVPKLDEKRTTAEIGEQTGESYKTVQRYIRLTYLVPELLKLVDERKVAMTPAVYLSYLSVQEQEWLLEEMAANDCTPSVSQAYRLKDKSQNGTLTQDFISELMCQEKANQKERIRIPTDRIRRYFPKGCTHAQMEDIIVKLCESYYRRRTEKDR